MPDIAPPLICPCRRGYGSKFDGLCTSCRGGRELMEVRDRANPGRVLGHLPASKLAARGQVSSAGYLGGELPVVLVYLPRREFVLMATAEHFAKIAQGSSPCSD